MPHETDFSKIDRRVVARMIRKNEVMEREVEKALKTLPDLADKGMSIETTFEESAGEGLEPDAR